MSEDWVNFVGKEEREGNGAHHVDSARDAGDALPFLACQQQLRFGKRRRIAVEQYGLVQN